MSSSKKSYVFKTKKKVDRQLIKASIIACYFETSFGIKDLITSLEWDLKFYLNPRHKIDIILYAWSYTFKTLSESSLLLSYIKPNTLLLGLNLG